uniref:E2F/DP family winged-helix DNA-binding domain-containing protein n=1 Tax=Xenopus tropicalis TaxID=8364 RepID=A0A6I8Q0T0_XENTR
MPVIITKFPNCDFPLTKSCLCKSWHIQLVCYTFSKVFLGKKKKNKAAEVLKVQERRISDITIVLEGIYLIKNKVKNSIQ